MPKENDFENDPDFAHHFEAAGIVDDNDPVSLDEDIITDDDQGQQEQEQQDVDPETEVSLDALANKAIEASDPKQPVAEQDRTGNGTDGGTQQGKAKEGTSVARPGDLVLPDGDIVRSGAERRWHTKMTIAQQQAEVATRDLSEAQAQAKELSTRVEAYERSMQTIGAENPQSVADAVRLYKDLARDPVSTLQTLLAEVAAQGHNLQGLGANIDTAAIARMIDQRIPRVETQQQQQRNPAEVEAEQFYTRFPDAVPHDEVLANIIVQHPHLTNEQAYYQLKEAALARGLNWNAPLGPQIAALSGQQQQQQNTGQQRQQPQQQRAPMNPGRGAQTVVERDNFVAPAGDTMQDIIRAAMIESGIQL